MGVAGGSPGGNRPGTVAPGWLGLPAGGVCDVGVRTRFQSFYSEADPHIRVICSEFWVFVLRISSWNQLFRSCFLPIFVSAECYLMLLHEGVAFHLHLFHDCSIFDTYLEEFFIFSCGLGG